MTFSVGKGILNTAINKLPFELHLPSYQFCGPGTKLKSRLERGDIGINPLDQACKQHDIAYSKSNNLSDRHKADSILQEAAWKRFKSKDAKFGERLAALSVAGIMKAKRKLGMGVKKRKVSMRKTIDKARHAIRKLRKKIKHDVNGNVVKEGSNIALEAAKAAVREFGGKTKIRKPRVIPIPKTGGILPLIPIFAGLSALGSLAGGAAGIAKAVNDSKAVRKQLEEATRHNKTMEAVALRNGKGVYLKPYRKGLGLYLAKPKN